MNSLKKNKIPFLKRYISGWYTSAEAENQLPHLLKKDNYDSTIKELDNFWGEVEKKAIQPDQEEMIQYKQEAKLLLSALKKTEKPARNKTISLSWAKYAAILFVVLGTTWGIYKTTQHSIPRISYTLIEVKSGQHKTVKLPDGSTVTLNACTRLTIPNKFTGKERRIQLDGEAYFSVVPDINMPFIVETSDMNVQVLGTSFNVKAYSEDDQYSICVESGKVQLNLENANIRLTADEQVIVDKNNGDFMKQEEPVTRVLSWRNNGLYFNRTPLRSVLHELYRIYGQRVELSADVDGSIQIFGGHDNKSFESILNSICYATGLNYKKENDRLVIYKP